MYRVYRVTRSNGQSIPRMNESSNFRSSHIPHPSLPSLLCAYTGYSTSRMAMHQAEDQMQRLRLRSIHGTFLLLLLLLPLRLDSSQVQLLGILVRRQHRLDALGLIPAIIRILLWLGRQRQCHRNLLRLGLVPPSSQHQFQHRISIYIQIRIRIRIRRTQLRHHHSGTCRPRVRPNPILRAL